MDKIGSEIIRSIVKNSRITLSHMVNIVAFFIVIACAATIGTNGILVNMWLMFQWHYLHWRANTQAYYLHLDFGMPRYLQPVFCLCLQHTMYVKVLDSKQEYPKALRKPRCSRDYI